MPRTFRLDTRPVRNAVSWSEGRADFAWAAVPTLDPSSALAVGHYHQVTNSAIGVGARRDSSSLPRDSFFSLLSKARHGLSRLTKRFV